MNLVPIVLFQIGTRGDEANVSGHLTLGNTKGYENPYALCLLATQLPYPSCETETHDFLYKDLFHFR